MPGQFVRANAVRIRFCMVEIGRFPARGMLPRPVGAGPRAARYGVSKACHAPEDKFARPLDLLATDGCKLLSAAVAGRSPSPLVGEGRGGGSGRQSSETRTPHP